MAAKLAATELFLFCDVLKKMISKLKDKLRLKIANRISCVYNIEINQWGLVSMVYKFFDKKSLKNEIKVYSSFKDNICGV